MTSVLQRNEGPQHWILHVEVGESDECWPWPGRHDPDGYPRVDIDLKEHGVHRLMAELTQEVTGPVHHTCENPGCINPLHLVATADPGEHISYHQTEKTTCVRGHDLTDPANISMLSRGEKRCRPCHAIRNAESYYRVKAQRKL